MSEDFRLQFAVDQFQDMIWKTEECRVSKNIELKVQSCKLYNGKYMISLTQITDSEIFAFIAVLVFMLLSRKVLFINRKDNRNC